MHLALVDFTGGFGSTIALRDDDTQQDIASGALFKTLQQYHEQRVLMGAGSASGKDTDITDLGIVKGHAYSVLNVQAFSDSNGEHQLIQLRNPWGNDSVWKGEWSDGSSAWTGRAKKLAGYKPGQARDGIFWMAFRDFCEQYRSVYVCRLLRMAEDGGTWHQYSADGEWRGETAGGCGAGHGRNPQYTLWVTGERPARVIVSLTQDEHADAHRTDNFAIAIKAFKLRLAGGARKGRRTHQWVGEKLNDSSYSYEREVLCDIELPPSEQAYTLIPATFTEGEEGGFRVTVYADQALVPPRGEEQLELLDRKSSPTN